MKLLPTTLLILIVTMIACKKPTNDEPTDNSSVVIMLTEQKIMHNWNFEHSVLNDFGANPGSDTIYGQSGDYYIFHTNNLAYSYWNNTYDTVSYQVLGASSMLYGGDTMSITTLNATEFVFKKIVQSGTSDYENVTGLSK